MSVNRTGVRGVDALYWMRVRVTPKWFEVTPKRPRIMVLAEQWYCDEALAEIAYIALLREKRLAPTGRDINGKGRS